MTTRAQNNPNIELRYFYMRVVDLLDDLIRKAEEDES